MGKTIGQLYSSDPASAIADANLFELEQSSNSKAGTFTQIWSWILTKASGVFDVIPAGYTDNLLHRGFIDGLILSNDAGDVDHDIAIAVGSARDSTNVISLVLPSIITKQIDASWAAGTSAGGMDTGSVATSQTYYQYLIRKDSDASIDALFSLSATAPTMPAGYTYKRRIMTIRTDSSSKIIPFNQDGDEVTFKQPINDFALAGLASANRIGYALSVPPLMKAKVCAIIRQGGTAGGYNFWIGNSSRTDGTPSDTNCEGKFYNTNECVTITAAIMTDATSKIYARGNFVAIGLILFSLGWIDDRGRNA
jgi:hypothetical protein